MMRAWGWFATIITIRIIMIISAQIISITSGWQVLLELRCLHLINVEFRYVTRPCAQVASVLGQGGTLAYYPTCSSFFDGTDPTMRVIVKGDLSSNNPVELGASLAIPFGAAGWLSLLLHTIAIETYVSLKPLQ